MICATHDSSFHEAKGSIRDLLISPSPVESSPVLYLQRGEWSWRGLSGLQFPTLTYKLFFCLCNSKMCKYIYNIYIRCPLSNLHAIHHSTLHWLSWWGPWFVGEVTLSLVPTREHGHIRACSTNCNFSKLTKLGTDQMD